MCRVPSLCPRLPEISVRPISEADRPFLARVYASTREDELAVTNWTVSQKNDFLAMQFEAQHHHYQQYHPNAAFDLILWCDKPIGRIYTDRFADEIRIIDIALLPEHRNHKIGTTFLQVAKAEARSLGRAIRLHVEQFNPAMHWYTRLGFQQISANGIYYLLEWRP